MIRRLIHRFFKKRTSSADPVQIVSRKEHGIERSALSEASRRTIDALQKQGFEAFVVGGAVRDLIAGIVPKDFDVATNATPEEVRRCFRRAHIIGRRFRIVHVHQGREIVEVTTFRGSHDDDDNKDEHGRLLRDNVFGSQAEDAARRDFTVNALYYDPRAETVHDYYHGVADLKQKTLRMIGEPQERYREDPVRMLRAVRLATRLDLTIDPPTLQPIREMRSLLKNVPAPRLFDEMVKLLTGGAAVKGVRQLRAEGLHHGLLPLLDVILKQPRGERFVSLSLQKTDERIREGKPVSTSFLFATLLWHEVVGDWERNREKGEKPIPALFQAMDTVLDRQCEQLAITRRIASDMKEIWALQPRFAVCSGKKPMSLLAHPRFRAGYDFLLLRAEAAAESDAELSTISDWWTRFIDAGHDDRLAMLQPATAVKKRRRRRRSKRAEEPETQSGNEQ